MHLNLFLQWLAANIDASNAIRVWLAADKLSLLNLKDVCFDYILAHKQEVLRRVDLGQLPVDVLNTILAHREVQDQVVSLNTHKPNELSLSSYADLFLWWRLGRRALFIPFIHLHFQP